MPSRPPAASSASAETPLAPPRARRARPRRSSWRRLGCLALALLAAGWLPGLLGSATGLGSLHELAVVSGYVGLSWAFPALALGLAARGHARDRAWPLARAQGVLVALAAAGVLVVLAANAVGG